MSILWVGTKKFDRVEAIFTATSQPFGGETTYKYDLMQAKTREEVLHIFNTSHPDVILLDYSLGGDVTKDICSYVRENEGTRHTGIIFVSDGEVGESTPVECLEIGADDFITQGSSDREVLARTNAVLRLKAMTDELRSANHKLQQLSHTDELTGLNNMRAFNAKYSSAIKDCKNGGAGLGVIMLDLDRFKSVNDTTDHLMGSYVISEVGKMIRSSGILGPNDCAARFGGDEYVIFTRDTDADTVKRKGEKIRRLIRDCTFIKDTYSINTTTSVGVSWVAPGFQGKEEDPIKAADMMLYRSKHDGRDRCSAMILREDTNLEQLSGAETVISNPEEDVEDLRPLAKVHNL